MKDNYSSLKLIAWLVVLVWAVLGDLLAWLCAWIWPLLYGSFPVTFVGFCGIYVVATVVVVLIIRAKLAQSSDA